MSESRPAQPVIHRATKPLPRVVRVVERLLALLGLVLLLVLTTPLVSWWARAYAGPIEQPKGDVLILLSAANDDNGGISFSSYCRARQAIYAWQNGGFSRIIISGGGGPGIFDYLISNGIPPSVIVDDSRSYSTRESGVEVAHLLQNIPGKRVLLTSDYHMFRAMRVFRKLGVDAAPMAVPDILQGTEYWQNRFEACMSMLLESTKIAYYARRGWI